jgi:ATP-binding cassette subfamily B multidrug efflux pump
LRRLFPYLLAHRAAFITSWLLLLCSILFGVSIPSLLKYAVESLRPPFDSAHASALAGIIMLFALMRAIVRTASRKKFIGLSRAIEYELRNDLFLHLQKLPPIFYMRMRTGDIMSRAVSDLNAVRVVVGRGLLNACNVLLIFPFCLGAMSWLSPRLTLYVVILYPLCFLGGRRLVKELFLKSRELQKRQALLSARLHENLTGAAVVRAYCQEEAEVRAFATLNDEVLACQMSLSRTRGFFYSIMTALGGAGALIVIYFGGRLVVAGEMTLGSFVAFNGYLVLLLWPTMALSWGLNLFQRGLAAMGRIGELLDEPPQEDSRAHAALTLPVRGAIEVRRLSYSYPPRSKENEEGREEDSVALSEVSFRIEPGEWLAVVGPVGAGKSTLAKLFIRLLSLPSNTLFLDGQDASQMSLEDYRRVVGYVSQDVFLFGDSIRENVRLGGGELKAAVLEDAVRRACLTQDFDQFPMGFDSLVGERGITLSGGQRSRVALARALVRDPAVLVLDDTLASVDLATENAILQELREVRGKKTCILITHRTAVAARADRIAVLSRGRLVGMGNHTKLLRGGGLYADFHRQQEIIQELGAQ